MTGFYVGAQPPGNGDTQVGLTAPLPVAQMPSLQATGATSVSGNYAGAATTGNAKATAGLVFGLVASNANSSIRYMQLYNTTGATSGAPVFSVPLPGGTTNLPAVIAIGNDMLSPNGLYLSTGITWAISTAANSYVAATANEHTTSVIFY
jgi:hypothetical protein